MNPDFRRMMVRPLEWIKRRPPALRSALTVLLITVLFLIVLAGITLAFYYFKWNWIVYGAIVGVIFGLVIGLVVLVNVPPKFQFAGVGAITGMSVDLLVTATTQESGPATALNALAALVANLIAAARKIAKDSGFPNPAELPLAVGLWVFLGTLGLMMLFGSLGNKTKIVRSAITREGG